MESNPWASLAACLSLCATALATPASGAPPATPVEQGARGTPGEVFRDCDVCPDPFIGFRVLRMLD